MWVCVRCVQLSLVADDDSGSFVQVMETFQNIGHILDMSVVDLDKQGQDLVWVCVYLHIHTMLHIHVHNTCMHPHPLSLFISLSLSFSLSLFPHFRLSLVPVHHASAHSISVKITLVLLNSVNTGIWSLHCGADDSGLDNTLVSFVGQTMWVQLQYSRKLPREKNFMNLADLEPPAKVFSTKFGLAVPTYDRFSIPRNGPTYWSLKVSCYMVCILDV